jgi:hypothetical protein
LCDQAEDISPHVIAAVSCYRRLLSAQNKRQGTCRPIITMIIAAFYLKEPITGTKILGIFVGAAGALTLILSGQQTAVTGNGSNNVWGDILCLIAQCSFSIYVVVYKGLIGRYSPVTLMKWMFTYSAICTIPFSYNSVVSIDFATLPLDIYLNIAVVKLLVKIAVLELTNSPTSELGIKLLKAPTPSKMRSFSSVAFKQPFNPFAKSSIFSTFVTVNSEKPPVDKDFS